jgi:hypothetical protein
MDALHFGDFHTVTRVGRQGLIVPLSLIVDAPDSGVLRYDKERRRIRLPFSMVPQTGANVKRNVM